MHYKTFVLGQAEFSYPCAVGLQVNFFHREYWRGFEWYRNQMPRSYKDQITMEKSPWGFMEPVTPQRVHKFNKTIKMILLVRDPVCIYLQ